jgi:hypothetical protein
LRLFAYFQAVLRKQEEEERQKKEEEEQQKLREQQVLLEEQEAMKEVGFVLLNEVQYDRRLKVAGSCVGR